MNINSNYTIRLGNRNIVKIMKGSTVIWEKNSTPVVTPDYLYIENTYNGSNTITFTTTASSTLPSSNNYSDQVEYSTDKVNWSTLTFNTSTPQTVTINTGDKLYLRNNSGVFNFFESIDNNYYTTNITTSQSHTIGGNINTLLNYNDPNNVTLPYSCFYELFQDDSSLTNITSLVLPSNTLSVYCYYSMFRGCTSLTTTPSLPATTLADRCYYSMFRDCTSLTTAPALPATRLVRHCYEYMFNGCTALTTAPTTLPATTLTSECYGNMFNGCTALTTAPTLPATTLALYCYKNMFKNCTSLTTAPSLPATILVTDCYYGMFDGCTSLTTTPALPSTTLATECYMYMFKNCTSLTTAPALPVTTLTSNCYLSMFQGCTSLTTAPELPATTLEGGCYSSMFCGCTSLTTAPSLPATTLKGNCYSHMFEGCTSLTTAPSLPATTLASSCYSNMFNSCISITTAPSLPATTLATRCYSQMFEGCTTLTTAPDLPATTLTESCYFRMFSGCTSLNEVTTYANDVSANECITNWLNRVASSGTLYNNGSATYTIDSVSGIPSGWTEVKPSTGPDYFYIENVDSNSGNVSFTFKGTPRSGTIQEIEWSNDRNNWTPVTLVANTTTDVLVDVGEKVYFRNSNGKCSINIGNYLNFNSTIKHKVGGDLYTLLDYTGENVSLSNYAFAGLFDSDTGLVNASDLVLRWSTLENSCYYRMFYGCTSLTTAPVLPATTLANQCYGLMFEGCTALTTAPVLPATTLANQCYYCMFSECTSLTTAPVLPATTLVSTCYQLMFIGCTSLNKVTTYADDISASDCIDNWLNNVAATGTLHNYGSAIYPKNSSSGIPSGWTEDNPFYIKNADNFPGNVSFTFKGTPSSSTIQQIEWSKDRNNWTSVTLTANTTKNVPVDVGEKVYFKNSNGKCSQGSSAYLKFGSDRNINVGGNIYTLLDYTNYNVSLPQYAFANLFIGNNKLLDASKLVLPWTTLSDGCYQSMFEGCTSLTSAPALPATNIVGDCYNSMFQGCTSLITAPELPSTTLSYSCYQSMFNGCTSLTTAPSLPATTLAANCYQQMFSGCSSLNSVTTYADDISATDCLTNWLSNVAATGNFYNNGSATYTVDSASGIPVGWTEVKPSTVETYFYIENVDSMLDDVKFTFKGTPSSDTIQEIEWSKDKTNWNQVTLFPDTINYVDIDVGEKVYFRNSNGKCSRSIGDYLNFNLDIKHKVGGNLYTLLDYTNENVPLQRYAFYKLFDSDTELVNASDLVLGWTTLENACYRSMFQVCTSLTTAPSLPATTLASSCYREMFTRCSSLNDVTIYADDISASGCLNNWLSGVASSGTFHNLGSATYPRFSPSGIPTGWTEVRS